MTGARSAEAVARPNREGPIVTLDGPAGSGKSSTAREVARRLGYRHLDSGALYRGLTYALLVAGVPEDRWEALGTDELRGLGVALRPADGGFDVCLGGKALTEELRTPDVTGRVSTLARLPSVRACLLDLQRSAGAHGRLVVDGRDMGTVVFPDAELKVYLVADLEERARRRLRETGTEEPDADVLAAEIRAISSRDEQDSRRAVSPLRKPQGALEIDTTALTFEEQVDRIVQAARRLTPS